MARPAVAALGDVVVDALCLNLDVYMQGLEYMGNDPILTRGKILTSCGNDPSPFLRSLCVIAIRGTNFDKIRLKSRDLMAAGSALNLIQQVVATAFPQVRPSYGHILAAFPEVHMLALVIKRQQLGTRWKSCILALHFGVSEADWTSENESFIRLTTPVEEARNKRLKAFATAKSVIIGAKDAVLSYMNQKVLDHIANHLGIAAPRAGQPPRSMGGNAFVGQPGRMNGVDAVGDAVGAGEDRA